MSTLVRGSKVQKETRMQGQLLTAHVPIVNALGGTDSQYGIHPERFHLLTDGDVNRVLAP